jgi:hypothetical protein
MKTHPKGLASHGMALEKVLFKTWMNLELPVLPVLPVLRVL